MGWLVALLVAAGAYIVLLRERKSAAANLRRVADWTAEIFKSNALPPTGPLKDPASAAIATNLERLARELESARRDQTAEASSLQMILTSMAEGVMVVDSRHIIRRVNPAFLRFVGIRIDPVGQSILRGLRDMHFEDMVTAALKSGQVQSGEISLEHAKPERHLSLAATPIREASGENAVVVICHDVTRLRQLEDVRRQFVANVSHELRTPLAIFQGYLENLLDNPDLPRGELVNVLEILKRHSTRLNALVEDLLVLARLESRVQGLNPEPIDARGLIDDVAADWQIPAKKKGVTLLAECSPGTPEFEADAFRIEQVLHNLVDNALKHTASGGTITLRAAPCASGVEIRVADTGIGIGPHDLPHIFERFYTADKARSREQGGTGLGLSIVKHIVQLHGGSVRAESIPGDGTSIIIELPIVSPSLPARSAFSGEAAAGIPELEEELPAAGGP